MKRGRIVALVIGIMILASVIFYVGLTRMTSEVTYRQVSFSELPEWQAADLRPSLAVFQSSCQWFLKQPPNQPMGTPLIPLTVNDWTSSCQAALKLNANKVTVLDAQRFFETWFKPVVFFDKKPVKGLFTGYYLPTVQASKVFSEDFSVPIYGEPDDLVHVDLSLFHKKWEGTQPRSGRLVGRVVNHELVPYYSREEIKHGALKDHAPILAWVRDELDRLELETEGSGILRFEHDSPMTVNYSASNGGKYVGLRKILIANKLIPKDQWSMDLLKQLLHQYPQKISELINQNRSFVFFHSTEPGGVALGSLGFPLTSGFSMAVDPQWVPLGSPVWLHVPKVACDIKTIDRLMVAQDVGGAIRGAVRGDIYLGDTKESEVCARSLVASGYYWVLLPKG